MNFNFVSEPLEFRACRNRENKAGQLYKILVFEDLEGYQQEISCKDENMFGRVARLRRGEMYRVPTRVFANSQYQFATLRDEPIEHVLPDGDLEEV